MDTRTWVAPPGAPRLDRALADAFPDLSRARIRALLDAGHVRVDGHPARASARPPTGAVVRIDVPAPVPLALVPERHDVPVLYEDGDLLVVVKPAGMATHPSPGHTTGTLVHAMLARADDLSGIGGVLRPGIVHRLDKGTSGVMVIAKNDAAHQALAAAFKVHEIERRYVAVVHRVPRFDQGVARSSLGRDPRDRLRQASVEEGGRPAVTHWRVLARGDRVALVECRLETGRTHQVRVHLSELGHPLVGDALYARRECQAPAAIRPLADALDHPLLHAWMLRFRHPRTGEPIEGRAGPPADFRELCAVAGLALPPEIAAP